MQTIGVLLVTERSGILSEIVRDIVVGDPGLDLAGEVTGAQDVADTVERTRADAVVWLVERMVPAAATELLHRHPGLRLVTVEADGREGFLWELRPHLRELGALSPDLLVGALRGSGKAAAS